MKNLIFTSMLSLYLILCGSCSKKVNIDKVIIPDDSRLGYTAVMGENNPMAYLLLFPGFGETDSNVLESTDLPDLAAKQGIAVFIPTLQDGAESYGFSDESQSNIRKIVADIRNRYILGDKPYCVGGFSMGGATAVRFAELAEEKPSALFTIDSPLDYKRFLYSTRRDIETYHKDTTDSIYTQLFNDIDGIKDSSPYDISDSTHSAIMPLKDVPVRFYIEPAEEWWLNERNTDALGLNIIDATCFINDLRLIGNDKADLFVTQNKGYRKATHQRHPHSWTIVDNDDLIRWLKQCMTNK